MLLPFIKPAGEFTHQLWLDTDAIYQQLIQHPFATGLALGNLPSAAFQHYLSQDMYYLNHDAQALDVASQRSGEHLAQQFLKRMAETTVEIEKAMNQSLSQAFGVAPAQVPSPVIEQYCAFLAQHTQHSHYAVALAALLPCFWLYTEVGFDIYQKAQQVGGENPYQAWIDCYHAPEFICEVETFIHLVEQQAHDCADLIKQQMRQVFAQGCQLELAFFTESHQQADMLGSEERL